MIPPKTPGRNMMEVGRPGFQSVPLLQPTQSVGSLFSLELFSFYLWLSLEDEGRREASLDKAETQVSVQYMLLNSHVPQNFQLRSQQLNKMLCCFMWLYFTLV